jgi:hypothetical protein
MLGWGGSGVKDKQRPNRWQLSRDHRAVGSGVLVRQFSDFAFFLPIPLTPPTPIANVTAMVLRAIAVFAAWAALALGCASTPGRPTADASVADAGVQDGGARVDGGAAVDGGPPRDGGLAVDGGGTDGGPADGGEADGGVDGGGDGGACPVVTVTPATASAGVDCDAPLDEAAIRAQVCAGTRIAPGMYNESPADHANHWVVEGDGSGNFILACQDDMSVARQVVLDYQGLSATLTGCESETSDYFSFEARTAFASRPDVTFRVNKCIPWPYILESPVSFPCPQSPCDVGQIGPTGVTPDAARAAHAAQYLWFVERDVRPDVYLVGGRPVAGPPVGEALCEAERLDTTIAVRKVTFTFEAGSGTVRRTVEPRGTFPANCP